MNPHFQQLISQTVVRQGDPKDKDRDSKYRAAKAVIRFRRSVRQNVKNAVLIILGIFSAACGLKSFLLPNSFIDGGATGISLLVTGVFGFPLSIVIVVVNIPFMILGYRQIGRGFALRSTLAILGLALVLFLVDFPIITNDKLLVAVFGGFFLGAGIGLAMRGSGVLDGTEVLAVFVSRKTGATIGDVILVINVIIFGAGAYLLGLGVAMYSILTYLAASRTVDFIIEGIEEYTGVTIISYKSDEIARVITEKLGHGISVYKGAGGHGKRGYIARDMNIIYTVVTRLEIPKLKSEIEFVDDDAFVIMHSIRDTKGGMIKKRPLKH